MVTRRKAAPYILKLGGLSHGTGQFYGQTAHNLTTELRELQDVENMKKFADGDPETFLQYWDQRQKTMRKSSPLYAKMVGFAAQAVKKLATAKDDAKALAEYAKTNNHKVYMDYLLAKLDEETDPANIAKIGTQVNELRARMFAAGAASGVLGGGVNQQELNDAEQAWVDAKQQAADLIMDRGGISMENKAAPIDILRLAQAADYYEGLLTRIAQDSGAPAKARQDATRRIVSTTRSTAGMGTHNTVSYFMSVSDARQIDDAGFSEKDNTQWQKRLADATGAVRARMMADRAYDAHTLAQGLLVATNKSALTEVSKTLQADANKAITVIGMTTSRLPQQSNDDLLHNFSQYTAEMKAAGVTPVDSFTKFKQLVSAAEGGPELSVNLGITKHARDVAPAGGFIKTLTAYPKDFLADLQQDTSAGEPATWDQATNTWKGSPEARRDAEINDQAMAKVLAIPGNEYERYLTQDPGMMTPADRQALSNGIATGQAALDLQQRQADMAETQQHAEQERADMAAQPAEPAAAAAPIAGSPEETAYDARQSEMDQQANPAALPGSGKKGLQSTLDNENSDFEQAVSGIDEYLNRYELADLPKWTAPEPTLGDMNMSFPFSTSSGTGVGAPPEAPAAPSRRGQAY